jgi:polyhydroxyalkanoate synthase
MTSMPEQLSPTNIAARLGLFDALPNAMARAAGALHIGAAALGQEPAPVAPTPYRLIKQIGAARLLRFESDHEIKHTHPVLLCPSVINRYYVLDLMAGTSVVQALQERGHLVYAIDWGEPGDEELELDFGDFVLGRLHDFVDAAQEDDHDAESLHLLGHCLGGTMAAALAALDDRGIATLTMLTAPVGFHDEGVLSAWTRRGPFDPRAVTGALGHVPAWLSQPSFMVLKPMAPWSKGLRLFQRLGDDRFVTFFRALETWINDNVSIPRGFYLDLVEKLYREDALVSGTLQMRGQRVQLENVKVPTLTITAKEDHIVPSQSAIIGHERIGAEDKRLEVFAGGHIGVVIGGLARRNLWPMLDTWFSSHTPDDLPPPSQRKPPD